MLVDKQEYDMVVDSIEPRKVDNVKMGWLCIVGDGTNVVVGLAVWTTKNDEKTTQIKVHTKRGNESYVMLCVINIRW